MSSAASGAWRRRAGPYSAAPSTSGSFIRSFFSSASASTPRSQRPLSLQQDINFFRRRHNNHLPQARTRTSRRYESTEPSTSSPPKPNSPSKPSNTTSSSTHPNDTHNRHRLTKILDSALRWTPRRLRPYGERLRAAPASHVVAFLFLHEATAIAPLLGLVALFKWMGWVPTAVVLGPWAEWAQEGLKTYGAYFRRKGWFGLGNEGGREAEGEVALEGRLREEVEAEQASRGGKSDGGGGRTWWGGKMHDQEEEVAADDEVGETSHRRKAWHKVKEVVTLGNMESGYNTGIQIAAAYTITKMLFPVRIAFSIWATPWGARLISTTWRAMRGKP